jgi:hypothetical protein
MDLEPVPAGMRWPTITFFEAEKLVTFSGSPASVKTFVVSWKLAAEMKLSVVNEAFVIPNRSGVADAGLPPF